MEKINKVFVVGTVVEVDTSIRQTADGRKYINGKLVVKSVSNGVENLIDLKVLAFELTKDGSVSKAYQTFSTLEAYLNKRVRVTAELREGSMVTQEGTIRKFNEVYAKFVSAARADAVDAITFEFNGFVVKPIYERTDREGNVIGYRIEVAQANYNDTAIQIVRFDIDKDDLNIASAIEAHYLPGASVCFNGEIQYTSRSVTKTEEVAFGNPVSKTYTSVEKVYRIKGGNEPYDVDSPNCYSEEVITRFIQAYKDADAARLAAAKESSAPAAPASPAAAAMGAITRRSSLI